MGLDQYGFTRQSKPTQLALTGTVVMEPASDTELTVEQQSTEIAYWRKHPNLQGFMAILWKERNPSDTDDDFNCQELVLTTEDLDRIEFCVVNRCLPATQGFFFGSDRDEEYRDTDIEFIDKARTAIAEGLEVYYYPSW
jgi:hypothetical protein